MVRSLAERMQAHEQQKARFAEQEAKLKTAERRTRTRRLIETGGLVDKAGLLDLDVDALYGALLSLRDGVDEKKQVEQWAALGGRAFALEARQRDEGKGTDRIDLPRCTRPRGHHDTARGFFRFNTVMGKDSHGTTMSRNSPKRMAVHSGASR